MDGPLKSHLLTGTTTLCRCWRVKRVDGEHFGFTDHDVDLSFDGTVFQAASGMTANTLETGNGLSADSGGAVGFLAHLSLDDTDILNGKFDGAAVEIWMVNWTDVSQRMTLFVGEIGEIESANGMFHAELSGPADRLGKPRGRFFQRQCPAVLGSERCGVDLNDTNFGAVVSIQQVVSGSVLLLSDLEAYSEGWFADGKVEVLSGPSAGGSALIVSDKQGAAGRQIQLWAEIFPTVNVGDSVRISAGCDRRFQTCRSKFHNGVNFQGFPHMPGDDWVMAVPRSDGVNDGGSLVG